MVFRAGRTSEHMALSLFVGIMVFFAQSFICTEQNITNAIFLRALTAFFSVLRLGLPAVIFAYMQNKAGFEECKIERKTECSVKYNIALAFLGFVSVFILGILYSAAFPASAASFRDESIADAVLTVISSAFIPALFEECLYRKLICRDLLTHGRAFAVIISALLFALAHFSFGVFPYAVVCGIILGFVYIKTGSARYTAAIHFANNFLAYVLSAFGKGMDKMDYFNMIVLIVIALCVISVGAVYAVLPNKKKFAFCECGNVSSSAFLTFPMTVYIFCSVLMNFI